MPSKWAGNININKNALFEAFEVLKKVSGTF